ncbi:MAG: MFS transporter [Desulfosarcina sp.]|nr:MFS transporter [Desulfobacterales bacterium]
MIDISKDKNIRIYAWAMLAILFAAQLVMSAGTYAWGPLAPFFRTEFGVSRTEIGILTSALYIVAATVSIPSGILVDKLGARAMLLFSLFVMGFAFIMMPIVGSFVLIALCAAIGGLGYGSINQATTKGIMLWFNSRTRATAMGIKKTGVTIGGGLAAALIPVIAMRYNWQACLFIIGGSILTVAFIAFFYKEQLDTDQSSVVKIKKNIRPKNMILTLVSNPVLLSVIIILPFISFCQTSFVTFLVLYLHEELDFSVQIAGICMTIAMVAGTAGRIVWGMLSDRMFNGGRIAPLLIISLISAASVFCFAILSKNVPLYVFFILSGVMGFALIGWNAVIMILAAELAGPELAGSSLGIIATAGWAGMVTGGPVFGFITDRFNYFAGWMLVTLVLLISAAGFIFIYFYVHEKKRVIAHVEG